MTVSWQPHTPNIHNELPLEVSLNVQTLLQNWETGVCRFI